MRNKSEQVVILRPPFCGARRTWPRACPTNLGRATRCTRPFLV